MTDDSPSDETVEEWLNKPLSDVTPDTVNTDEMTGYIPIEALEQLADEWAERNTVEWREYYEGRADAKEECAQELRELVEEHR